MALHKLVFDATDADTRAASANVGAYLRSSDGTLLTHTDVGGKKALDVRVAEGINVEVDLSHLDDSVAIGDGTDLLDINADGSINITDNGGSLTVDASQLDIDDLNATDDAVAAWLKDGAGNSISSTGGALHISDAGGSLTVDASQLDIDDLDQGTDSVAIGDGTNLISLTASGEVKIVDNGNSITVDASQLDIDDLNATDDAVAAWLSDGSGNAISSTAGALDVNIASGSLTVNDAALADSAIKAVAETVGVAAAAIVDGADELASRKYLFLYNNGNREAYVGQSGITTSTGFPLPPGAILEARIGAAVDVFMIADAAGQDIRTLQLS